MKNSFYRWFFWIGSVIVIGVFAWFIKTPMTLSVREKTLLYEPNYLKTEPFFSPWKNFQDFLKNNPEETIAIDLSLRKLAIDQFVDFIDQKCHRTASDVETEFWLAQMRKGAGLKEIKRWIKKDFQCKEPIASDYLQNMGFYK